MKPTRSKTTILRQVMSYIPGYLVSKLAHQYGVDEKSRKFTPWSHVVSMVFAQISHALSLNDVCDTLRNHSGTVATLRGAAAPSRNGLSNANKERNADMAEALFWGTLADIQKEHPKFGTGRSYVGFPKRFKRIINVVDSTTIQLVANCIDWARHRRRKAAAKCHMRLDLQTFLPKFALVKSAGSHDAKEARELCGDIRAGEVVVFDKAYVDFVHLHELHLREVSWVNRAKDNMSHTVVRKLSKPHGNILEDVLIRLKVKKSRGEYPDLFRLVRAQVEIDGKFVEMTFITNNITWAASSICELYKARWGIEVFFKELKQTLQLADFLGHNENAVRWQIWTALLTYVIMRLISYIGSWKGSFSRLFTVVRGVIWSRLVLYSILDACCGTAGKRPRMCAEPYQTYMTGLGI